MTPRSLLLSALLACIAMLSAGDVRQAGAITADYVVDLNIDPCVTPSAPGGHFFSVADAVEYATTQGTTIYVCAGVYNENIIQMDTGNVTLTGPGSTPEDDGAAIIRKVAGAPYHSRIFNITSDYVKLRGMYVDGTPPVGWPNTSIIPIESSGLYSEISDNVAVHAFLSHTIRVYGFNAQVLRNRVLDSDPGGIYCECDSGYFQQNEIGPNVGADGLSTRGPGQMVLDNTLIGSSVTTIDATLSTVTGNTIDMAGLNRTPMWVSGDYMTVANNTIENAPGTGLLISNQTFGAATSVAVSGNTIQNVGLGIDLIDDGPVTPGSVNATIGGSQANANTFRSNTTLLRNDLTTDINAEYNDWGLCTLTEIEARIIHKVDAAGRGTVDFDPFIPTDTCATPTPSQTASPAPTPSPSFSPTSAPTLAATPTPTSTPTLTPTPSASATPAPTNSAELVWGDSDCDGGISSRDNQALLRAVLSQPPLSQTEPCPDLGISVSGRSWGDWDCDGAVTTRDNQALLRRVLGQTPLSQTEPCQDIGIAGIAGVHTTPVNRKRSAN